MKNNIVYVGVDPGKKGAITILDNKKVPQIFDIPLSTFKVGKKNKTEYNLDTIISILRPYESRKVKFFLEKANPRPREGVVSSFSAGDGFGQLKGVAKTLGFDLIIVFSRTWKKDYPTLAKSFIQQRIEENIKEDKELEKRYKKNKNYVIKYEAKDSARRLATKMFPKLADMFKRKKDDGRAESLLIALYGKKISELV